MTSIVPPTLPSIILKLNLDTYHKTVEDLATYLHPLLNRDIFELYGFILKQFNLYELTIKRYKQIITDLTTALFEQFTTPVFSSLKAFRQYLFSKLFYIWLPPTVTTTCGVKRKIVTCEDDSALKRVHFIKNKKTYLEFYNSEKHHYSGMNGARLSFIISQAWKSRHNCVVCGTGDKENTLLLCDGCDKGSHTTCIGLSKVPKSEEWFCELCVAAKTKSCLKVIPVEPVKPVVIVELFEPATDQMTDVEYADYQFYKFLCPTIDTVPSVTSEQADILSNEGLWHEFMGVNKQAIVLYKTIAAARHASSQKMALYHLSQIFLTGGGGIKPSEEKAARYKKFEAMCVRARNQVATRQDDKFYFLADKFFNEKQYLNAIHYYKLLVF